MTVTFCPEVGRSGECDTCVPPAAAETRNVNSIHTRNAKRLFRAFMLSVGTVVRQERRHVEFESLLPAILWTVFARFRGATGGGIEVPLLLKTPGHGCDSVQLIL